MRIPGRIRRGLACCAYLVLCVSILACPGGDQRTAADTAATPDTPSPQPTGEFTAETITPQMIAQGNEIFHGRAAGGICFTCHGQGGVGTELGPNLTDNQWLWGDGSPQAIAQVVRNGVPQPREYSAPMPPMGAQLNEQQVRAVSAYVYSLSRR